MVLIMDFKQVSHLLENQLVEEAVLLAETIAAVEANKDPRIAESVSILSCRNTQLYQELKIIL